MIQNLILTVVCVLASAMWNSPQAQSGNTVIKSDDTSLVIGIFPRRDPSQTIRMFTPLKNHLQQKLGRNVILETAPDFKSFKKILQSRRYDLVHFNQYHYVQAHENLHYDALVQNEEFGQKNISGSIFVRKDSGISSLSELRGQSILFGGGKEAMMSYIVPLYLLAEAGLQPQDFKPMFASSPPNSILAVYTRQAIAGGAGNVTIHFPAITQKIDVNQLQVLATSEPVAHLPWAVKQEMPEILKQHIQEILLTLKDTQQGQEILQAARLSGMNPATDTDYNRHREIIFSVKKMKNGAD